jgi:hypothetical protein
MKEAVAIAKEADMKKGFSPTRSDNSVQYVRDEPERQLGSLRDVIGNIRRDGGTPSVESIATELSGMHSIQRAPALLALQRTHGNRYVQRVFSGIQAKLKIGQPGDMYEQEADRVAEQVMRMPEPEMQRQEEEEKDLIHTKPLVNQITPLVQMQVEEEELLQAKNREMETPEVTHDLESQINAIKGGGRPLAESERAYFEPRFGVDFSRVRVHTDAKAAESTQVVNARAYTVGQDVVFGAGQYIPTTTRGKKIIAHELMHVVQQSGVCGKQRSSNYNSPATGLVQLEATSRPTSQNVWGLSITRSMCGCRQRVRDGISWANTAAATYAACDIPANPTGTDIEACFDAAHPGTTTVGTTSPSGTMTLPPPSADPCERIENKATFVHETMHSRHASAIARAQGTAFFREWRRLAGDPNRLNTLRATFPAQVAAFETQWNDGHDWAQDEVNSYKWERRFLVDARAALNRIC